MWAAALLALLQRRSTSLLAGVSSQGAAGNGSSPTVPRFAVVRTAGADRRPPSAGKRGARVLFGVQTTAKPVYVAKLNAGLDTWLQAVPAEDRIIIGPRCAAAPPGRAAGASADASPGAGHCGPWEPSTCDDESQLCKHMALLDRAQGRDFDWFVTLGEDHVVMADLLKASLAYLDPTIPAALASIGDTPEDGGCGQNWNYTKWSKNGTVPMPHDWVEPDDAQSPCLAVKKRGGLCGGTGIVYSRAALERLFADGRDAFWRRMEPLIAKDAQYDTGMSCALLDRGVKLNQGCGLMQSFSLLNVKTENPANVRPSLIYHVAGGDDVPQAMRTVWTQLLARKKDMLVDRRNWVSRCLGECSVRGFCRAPPVEGQDGQGSTQVK